MEREFLAKLAFWQAANASGAEIVLQVEPTAPFLYAESVDAAVDLLREHGVDSVVGCRCEALYLWRGGKPAYFRAEALWRGLKDVHAREPVAPATR